MFDVFSVSIPLLTPAGHGGILDTKVIEHPSDNRIDDLLDGLWTSVEGGTCRYNDGAGQHQQFKVFHVNQIQRRFARNEDQLPFLFQDDVGGSEQGVFTRAVSDATERAH